MKDGNIMLIGTKYSHHDYIKLGFYHMFHIKPLYIYISLTRQFPLISQQIYFLRELGDLKDTSYAYEN